MQEMLKGPLHQRWPRQHAQPHTPPLLHRIPPPPLPHCWSSAPLPCPQLRHAPTPVPHTPCTSVPHSKFNWSGTPLITYIPPRAPPRRSTHLHVSSHAQQQPHVHTQRPDICPCLTADPEHSQVVLLVILYQLALVDGAHTQLTLNCGRRLIEHTTSE